MKTKKWSKKTLIQFCMDRGYISTEGFLPKGTECTKGVAHKSVSFEIYGKDAQAYINVKDMAARTCLELLLISEGQKVSRTYWPGHPVVNVKVTYFKGWHWDE
jgi:hypothetical protein